jgi:hypothetical protein
MRRTGFAVALTLLLGMGTGRSAWAHTIAVVRPDRADQTLVEAFSRLCGELRMYGLQVRLLDGLDEAAALETSSAQHGRPDEVVGGVSLMRTPGQASARIWVTASAPGKESVRITVSVADADAPSLLAIRAADLLRASLRDLRSVDLAPTEPKGKPDAGPKPPATKAETETEFTVTTSPAQSPPAQHLHRWAVHAGPATLLELGRLGAGWGATVQAKARVAHRLALALDFTAPVRGQTYDAGSATAHVRQELATLAIALQLLSTYPFNLDVFQGLGVMHLSVHGEAQGLWVPQDSSTWAAASSTGTTVGMALSEHFSLQASAAALFLLPRPIVDVADVSYMAHQPLLLIDVGLSFAF